MIATNGSIMPPDEVLSIIKKYDVIIRVSDYGIDHDKARGLMEKCRVMGIRCPYYEFASDTGKWNLLGGTEIEREQDDEIVAKRYRDCHFRGCLTLERGELSYCSRATNSYAIQHFKRKKGDYLKVRNDRRFAKNLKKYVIKRHFMEACRYCNGTDDRLMVEPAIQMEAGSVL